MQQQPTSHLVSYTRPLSCTRAQYGGENLEMPGFLVVTRRGSSKMCARQSTFGIGDRKLRNRAGGSRRCSAVRRKGGWPRKQTPFKSNPLFRACVPLKIEGSRGGGPAGFGVGVVPMLVLRAAQRRSFFSPFWDVDAQLT